MVGAAESLIDFFISRAVADAAVADEIGRILDDEGHSVIVQQCDLADRDFMERMHASLESGARVIALLSPEYLASAPCMAECLDAIADDPLNKRGRLIVLRAAECAPTGLLRALAYWDLVPVRDDPKILRDVVLAAVEPGRHEVGANPGAPYWGAPYRQEPRSVVHPEIKATPSFTGREDELGAIHSALWSDGAAVVTQPAAVHGLGGIGKSVLVREYAYRNRDRYAGVWWLNATKPDDAVRFDGIETALVDLGNFFIRNLDQARDRAAAARRALDFIAHGGFEKPWLLIYDNADDIRALHDWAPLGNAQVLVATRISDFPKTVNAVEIAEWDPPDAIRYLLDASGREDLTEDDARTLADELGCLPLALSHAAAYLRARPDVAAKDYADTLVRRTREAPKGTEYPRAVYATVYGAAEQAEAEAPGARAAMSLAAFCAPDAIPEELLQGSAECDLPGLAALMANADAMDDALSALGHLALIDLDPARRVFSIHRLTQAAVRDTLGAEGSAWAESALRAIARAFPAPEPKTWRACERLVAHARAVAPRVPPDRYELGVLLGRAGTYLQKRAALGDVLPLYERYQRVFERLAAADPSNTDWQRDLSVSHIKVGDVLLVQGKRDEALDAYRASLDIRDRLAAARPDNAVRQRGLSVSHNKVGNVLVALGKPDEALDAYRASLAIRERLAAADPANATWWRDLSVSQEKIGNVLVAQGKWDEALDAYRESLAIRERLAATDPANMTWRRDLSVSHSKAGKILAALGRAKEALDAYRASLDIIAGLAAADPNNNTWRRHLSVSNDRIGDVLTGQGKGVEALEAYRASVAALERLAATDPSNARWRRDLSMSQEKIGNVLMAQGKGDEALDAYRASLRITDALAAADPANPTWRRDLSVGYDRIGDVLRDQGKCDEALDAYRASLKIAEALAAADPANVDWRRDLSVSHIKVGDSLVAQGKGDEALDAYRASQDIIARLAAADPANPTWRRDLSVSHDRIGDVLVDQGRKHEAVDAYRASLDIRVHLAAADPANATWQRDLSVSHVKMGDSLADEGKGDKALDAYRTSLDIAETLAGTDPANAGWQRDVFVSYTRLALVNERQGKKASALGYYQRASDIIRRLADLDPANATWSNDLAWVEDQIANLSP